MEVDKPVEIDLSYSNHSRLSEYDRLIYPVVSRRSRGLSLGINLNPDKRCNFDCVYCQVDRSAPLVTKRPSIQQIQQELDYWLVELEQGEYQGYQLQDIAIAGDGEPTSEKQLPKVLELLLEMKKQHKVLADIKLVLFTNGSGIDRKDLSSVFPQFFASRGEVWFKLDAWDQASQNRINRSRLQFQPLMDKLKVFGRQYPVVLQSCFFQWQQQIFSESTYHPYLRLVRQLMDEGVTVEKIQAYTLARVPTEPEATPWANQEMDRLAAMLRSELKLPVELFYEKGSEA